jgi:hypothetical protein
MIAGNIFCEAHNEILNDLKNLKGKIEKFESLTIINGKEKKVHLAEIVREIYYDVEVIRDFNKLHTIFKKYRIYYIILILIMLILGFNYKEIFIKIFK